MGVRLLVAGLAALCLFALFDSSPVESRSYFVPVPVTPPIWRGGAISPAVPRAPPVVASANANTVWSGDGRKVIERLFRQPASGPPLIERSENELLTAAAAEVRQAASTFGPEQRKFADEWLDKVLKTEDSSSRLEIMDECFVSYFDGDYLGAGGDCMRLEDALRKFRILLAPETGIVKQARQRVREVAGRFGGDEVTFVDKWLAKVDSAKDTDEEGVIMDECIMTAKMGGEQSLDCYELEESLRNYRTAIRVWQQEEQWNPELV